MAAQLPDQLLSVARPLTCISNLQNYILPLDFYFILFLSAIRKVLVFCKNLAESVLSYTVKKKQPFWQSSVQNSRTE